LDTYGMGFATNSDNTWRDKLYIADENSVAEVDINTWEFEMLGQVSSQSEMTGNNAGELWAFMPLESPAAIVQLNKDTGQEEDRVLVAGMPSLGNIDTFAFATWGGDFWVFIREYGMGTSTDVYQISMNGQMNKVRSDVGYNIVGAGVSTCAPDE